MKTILPYLFLISIPALISSDYIIMESHQHKKRSIEEHAKNPERELEIYGMKIESKVTSRFAHNVVISRVVNRANESKEAFFEMELPKTAFITNFSMTLDGVTYMGAVKEKQVAQQQYQQAVSRGQSAGLVKASGRKMEKFKVSVNIGPTKKVTFELTYEELLKRNLGKYAMQIRVKPKQFVKHFQIDVHIFEPHGIAFLNVDAKFLTNNLTSIVKKTLTETRGHVFFKPTLEQQRKCPDCHETILDGDFIIEYDVNRDLSAGSVQIINGYFVHHFAPANLPIMPKNVIFVIDHSGSMSGTKMSQTNEALLKILDDMGTEDHFAIIPFDSSSEIWKNAIHQATPSTRTEAKMFVQNIRARGGTNINDPMLKAVSLLNKAHQDKLLPERSVSMIILLTDGDPNEGVSNPTTIQQNVKSAINGRYNVYCLGFGFDVKYSFLEKMALENNGVARRIYEDSDAPLQLQRLEGQVVTCLKQFEASNKKIRTPKAHHSRPRYKSRVHAFTSVDSDPHFIASINDHSDAICFNVDGKPGAILNLVTDPYKGFVVNGQLIGVKEVKDNKKMKTYFGKLGIANNKMDVKVEISTEIIAINHGDDEITFPWSETVSLTKESFSISIVKERNLTLTMGDDAKFVIVLHHVRKNHTVHRDFLGFYTLDSHNLSNVTHGLLGQFYNEVNAVIRNISPRLHQDKLRATMIVKGHKLRVTRVSEKDYRLDSNRGINIPCWFVHSSGKGFIDGIATDYVVSSLFNSLHS
ncbi:inter-alpha-trypsin inhibitor heavy chain H3-like [Rhincodon typus]|uniref:inter-alpha-trypsin inhibitor heavy chain H3-like n=1 Tax=Rhincodon typus TaxID=259920 RepID=UPI00202FECB4|nr:inter-alpha-trypsin inhibitor heavy chain H3-like [Rhincodon typus]